MNKPLRFCMLTTFYPPNNFGGDGIFVSRLSNELARRGHRVDVIHCIDSFNICNRNKPVPVDDTLDDHPNITVHRLKSPFGWLSPFATYQTGYPVFKSDKIRSILNRGFDVIHYHNISLLGGPGILEYGNGIKLYTMHEYWLVCPTHVLLRFNRKPCSQTDCLLCTLIHKRPPQLWRYTNLLKSTLKHIDSFIAPSHFIADMHKEMGININTAYLHHFVPTTKPRESKSKSVSANKENRPYFLFVGRLEKLKGLQTIIPVFRQFDKAQLIIAGTGSYETSLKRQATGIDHVKFIGHIDYQNLTPLYKNAVAVIVPSICHDISPQVISEAVSNKTPALTTNTGGMPELIDSSGGGLIYENETHLLALMKTMVSNPTLRHDLGLSGYQAYLREWTDDTYVERYFDLIKKISNDKRNKT